MRYRDISRKLMDPESCPREVIGEFILFEYDYVFEREPREDEHILTFRYLRSPDDVKRTISEALKDAEIDPALQYAFSKLGYLLTEMNIESAKPEEIKAWDDAISEYTELSKNEESKDIDYSVHRWYEFTEEINSIIVSLGYAAEYAFDEHAEHTLTRSQYFSVESFMIYCCLKVAKVLKSTMWLLEKDVGEESLALIRNVYETYIKMTSVRNNPDYIEWYVDCVLGIEMGTHEYIKCKGKIRRDLILNLETGEKISGPISTHAIVKSSGVEEDISLRKVLYKYLSDFVHPSSINMANFIDNSKENMSFTPHKHTHVDEACILAITCGSWVVDLISKLEFVNCNVKKDLRTVARRISLKSIELIEKDIIGWENKPLFKGLHFKATSIVGSV